MPKKFKVVRMDKQHLEQVHKINRVAFTDPWAYQDFESTLLQRDVVGLVSLDGDTVTGYLIYERHRHLMFLLNMACSDGYARQGVVSGLIDYVKSRLKEGRQERIETDVPELADDCIKMLRKAGFRATGVNRGQFEQGPDKVIDGYTFEYSLSRETPRNRIAKFLQSKKRT